MFTFLSFSNLKQTHHGEDIRVLAEPRHVAANFTHGHVDGIELHGMVVDGHGVT